eukprot:scaffold4771_cov129-Isochrysis_galbana.AAC.10
MGPAQPSAPASEKMSCAHWASSARPSARLDKWHAAPTSPPQAARALRWHIESGATPEYRRSSNASAAASPPLQRCRRASHARRASSMRSSASLARASWSWRTAAASSPGEVPAFMDAYTFSTSSSAATVSLRAVCNCLSAQHSGAQERATPAIGRNAAGPGCKPEQMCKTSSISSWTECASGQHGCEVIWVRECEGRRHEKKSVLFYRAWLCDLGSRHDARLPGLCCSAWLHPCAGCAGCRSDALCRTEHRGSARLAG